MNNLYFAVMFPKIDILLDWMGISPLNRRDIMAFFRSVATQAVDIRQEENSVRIKNSYPPWKI